MLWIDGRWVSKKQGKLIDNHSIFSHWNVSGDPDGDGRYGLSELYCSTRGLVPWKLIPTCGLVVSPVWISKYESAKSQDWFFCFSLYRFYQRIVSIILRCWKPGRRIRRMGLADTDLWPLHLWFILHCSTLSCSICSTIPDRISPLFSIWSPGISTSEGPVWWIWNGMKQAISPRLQRHAKIKTYLLESCTQMAFAAKPGVIWLDCLGKLLKKWGCAYVSRCWGGTQSNRVYQKCFFFR